MIEFREPFSFITDSIEKGCTQIAKLFCSTYSLNKKDISRLDGNYVVGPNILVKEIANGVHFKEIFESENPDFKLKNKCSIAKGLFVPFDYEKADLPIVLYYKIVPELKNKPVLTKEYKMKPGEFLIIPESSEVLCVVSYQDSRMDAKTELPKEFIWIDFSKEGYTVTPKFNFNLENAETSPEKRALKKGNNVELPENLIETSISSLKNSFANSSQHFQLFPFLNNRTHELFKEELEKSKLWVRRTGDIYTQVAMDIIEWSKQMDCPSIVKDVLKIFESPLLIKKFSKLTNIDLKELKEISAYRMVNNEFVANHADGTFNDLLKIRVNWLVQNPSSRTDDMRFWNPFDKTGKVTIYQAIENSITVFKMGEETPHDIAPVPNQIDKDRINIVFTYG